MVYPDSLLYISPPSPSPSRRECALGQSHDAGMGWKDPRAVLDRAAGSAGSMSDHPLLLRPLRSCVLYILYCRMPGRSPDCGYFLIHSLLTPAPAFPRLLHHPS